MAREALVPWFWIDEDVIETLADRRFIQSYSIDASKLEFRSEMAALLKRLANYTE